MTGLEDMRSWKDTEEAVGGGGGKSIHCDISVTPGSDDLKHQIVKVQATPWLWAMSQHNFKRDQSMAVNKEDHAPFTYFIKIPLCEGQFEHLLQRSQSPPVMLELAPPLICDV